MISKTARTEPEIVTNKTNRAPSKLSPYTSDGVKKMAATTTQRRKKRYMRLFIPLRSLRGGAV